MKGCCRKVRSEYLAHPASIHMCRIVADYEQVQKKMLQMRTTYISECISRTDKLDLYSVPGFSTKGSKQGS
jgi:hypothetical protein